MKGLIKGQWPEDLETCCTLARRLLAELSEDNYRTRTVIAHYWGTHHRQGGQG